MRCQLTHICPTISTRMWIQTYNAAAKRTDRPYSNIQPRFRSSRWSDVRAVDPVLRSCYAVRRYFKLILSLSFRRVANVVKFTTYFKLYVLEIKNLSSLHTLPAFHDQCEVNVTLFTKIQTTEAVGYWPTETENFSLPQSAMKAYCL
jgi:hypothetical protein